jgi:thiamine biosynthesis lipoprotein
MQSNHRPGEWRQLGAASVVVMLVFLLVGCAAVPPGTELRRFEFQQPHMGTLFTLTLYAPDETAARAASDVAFARIAALDQMLSDYNPESELMRLCRQPFGQPVRVSDELFAILQQSQGVAELSDGAFDVTIGPVVRLWRRSRRTETLPSPEALAHAREAVGWRKLKLNSESKTVTLTVPNMQLDLGGIAKGWAADAALAVLKTHGATRALVAASGDIAAGEPPPGQRGWRVEIAAPVSAPARSENLAQRAGPETGAPIVHSLLLENAAVSTSGDAEQFVEIDGVRYSHIVDPRTGLGLTERLQVTVIAKRASETDSFATAVSVLGVKRGLALVEAQPGMAAVILRKAADTVVVTESARIQNLKNARRLE